MGHRARAPRRGGGQAPMFAFLPLAVASLTCQEASNTNCPHCFDADGCAYCFDTNGCYPRDAANCTNPTTTRTKECIAQLGGDAKDSVRYAIGFSVLGVALAVDGIIRFVTWRRKQDTYNHL
jgi:hypothetical protein